MSAVSAALRGIFKPHQTGLCGIFKPHQTGQTAQVPPLVLPKAEPLLESTGTVLIPDIGGFNVGEHFMLRPAPERTECVNIVYIGGGFRTWFSGKVEKPTAADRLQRYRLRRCSRGNFIIAELGGEERAKTTLGRIFSLLSRQKNGEAGILLSDRLMNIFYALDISNQLRMVSVIGRMRRVEIHNGNSIFGGWEIDASPIESVGSSFELPKGCQVFSDLF